MRPPTFLHRFWIVLLFVSIAAQCVSGLSNSSSGSSVSAGGSGRPDDDVEKALHGVAQQSISQPPVLSSSHQLVVENSGQSSSDNTSSKSKNGKELDLGAEKVAKVNVNTQTLAKETELGNGTQSLSIKSRDEDEDDDEEEGDDGEDDEEPSGSHKQATGESKSDTRSKGTKLLGDNYNRTLINHTIVLSNSQNSNLLTTVSPPSSSSPPKSSSSTAAPALPSGSPSLNSVPLLGNGQNQSLSATKPHHHHHDVVNIESAVNDEGEQIIIIEGEDDEENENINKDHFVDDASMMASQHKEDLPQSDEPIALPLRPIIRGPFDDDDHQGEMSVVYAEQHSEVRINCEVDMDITTSIWFHDSQMIHPVDRSARPTSDFRFIKETRGGLTITNVMLEDNGKWQCEAENAHGYMENARPVKLVVLDRPKAPYLLIDSRRLDAGNIFVPVKENSELSLACISEGGNPKPALTWEILLSPGVDRHAQKISHELTHLQDVKKDSDKEPYKINSGSISEVKLPVVYRAHHNARILCVMEHPTLKIRQNASLLLDVQYTPSFAISRTPGFGYPLREGIEVSLKCDVDSNPTSTPIWQKDDGDPPVPQAGDGYLNFTSIKREHTGWYKCTARHLNFQYTSIGYYLSVRYDSVDVTSEPIEQEMSMAAASHNPFKAAQMEVQLGGAVTLQCPQGSLGCWSQLDPVTARLKGLGVGLSLPTGQSILKDVVYQDAGIYKCIGQNPNNKKKMDVLHTVAVAVKGPPTAAARNATPVAYPGSPLHLSVEFCANPPAFAARWLHGDRVYTPGNQYGVDVLAYGVIDLPTPFCKEARLTYVRMHERVQRTFYFVVSSPGGVAEAIFRVNFTQRHKATMSNAVDDSADDEELREPEEIHFPDFGSGAPSSKVTWSSVLAFFFLLLTLSSPILDIQYVPNR